MKFDSREWLLSNDLGSFAMGSVDRVPRRKYHGLWISRSNSEQKPEHFLLDLIERIQLPDSKESPLVNFDFGQGAGSDGIDLIENFSSSPLPTWNYSLPDSLGKLSREISFLPSSAKQKSSEGIRVSYRRKQSSLSLPLILEPLFTIRNLHELCVENLALDGIIEFQGDRSGNNQYLFSPYYDCLFLIEVNTVAEFNMDGRWYRNFFYSMESERGYQAKEDCFSPGRIELKIPPDGSIHVDIRIMQSAMTELKKTPIPKKKTKSSSKHSDFFTQLSQSLTSFCYQDKRLASESIIAGYPWFSTWARDSFVTLPGLSLAWDDPNRALSILAAWAPKIEQFLFDKKESRDFDINCSGLDSPFFWARALAFLCEYHPNRDKLDKAMVNDQLQCLERWMILFFEDECKLANITDFGFLCKAGVDSHLASSWMDAIVDGKAVLPRQGYPIEINAMFFDAIQFLLQHSENIKAGTSRLLSEYLTAKLKNFPLSYWVSERNFIADGYDGFQQDAALRPNQLWLLASNSNPFSTEQSISAILRIRDELLTPYGLRTLSPIDSRYVGSYRGDQRARDTAYHQGTVWPWLLGIFTEAALKYFTKQEVSEWLQPCLLALQKHWQQEACLEQVSEIFDGDAPHVARGAPAQAWSAAELLRTLWMLEP